MYEGLATLSGVLRHAATIDGRSVDAVRVNVPNGYPIDLSIDPATGAYAQAVIDPGGSYETTFHILRYSDALPGKRLITS